MRERNGGKGQQCSHYRMNNVHGVVSVPLAERISIIYAMI